MSNNINETQYFGRTGKEPENEAKRILISVSTALREKGYNPVNQIVGYILSGDPTYITSYLNARAMIRKLERDELLEELVKDYLDRNEYERGINLRILGLDFGDKTIGVAVSDPLGWTAQGVEIIKRENPQEFKKCMRRLAEIIEQYQVDTIVLGYPKNLDNSEGERCEKTKVFEAKIKGRFPKIPVVLWDERFSTIAAERALRMADLSHDKRKSVIDKMAAVHILQGYLDSKQ